MLPPNVLITVYLLSVHLMGNTLSSLNFSFN